MADILHVARADLQGAEWVSVDDGEGRLLVLDQTVTDERAQALVAVALHGAG